MTRKYVAFDIETAKVLPARVGNLHAHRPLGICCAATLIAGDDEPQLWHGRTQDQRPAPRMTSEEAAELVRYLAAVVDDGLTVLTWNGLGFDFDILAEELGMWDECRRIASGHVDMMFHAFCELGHTMALDRASAGMGLEGKSENVAAHMAPQLWAEGKTDEVLDYVARDVRATLELALACERQRVLRWLSRTGSVRNMPLNSGWLTVADAMRLPEPDTSWMDKPIPRARFTGWLSPG